MSLTELRKLIFQYKYVLLLGLCCLILTSLYILITIPKLFQANPKGTVVSTPTPITQEDTLSPFESIAPGKTKIKQLSDQLIDSTDSAQTGIYFMPTETQQRHEIITQADTVKLIREKHTSLRGPYLVGVESKFSTQPTQYLLAEEGPVVKLVVYSSEGHAFLVHTISGRIYETWYFEPTTDEELLKLAKVTVVEEGYFDNLE